ncbi:hypothetical protein HELRODRAFT_188312 [Helobdella robusta]|uniref:G-protein coupled receptors family 1 profile domain-containing protein n=1 Tax=Helobdella robusta TaxID=6412 RepID=T1FPV1_HELRO|nr:hypothetical protein HELRODRAFT_188312 [Helobdella robusta]ESO06275.1 hypothetical protein HELRODRAFT_188312 [Helobdella robusta]
MNYPKYFDSTALPYNATPFNDTNHFWFGRHKGNAEQNAWVFLSTILLSLTSLLGNSLTLIAFLSWRQLRTGQNILLCNVAFADIIFTICSFIPAIITHNHVPGEEANESINPVSILKENINNKNSVINNLDGHHQNEVMCRGIHYLLSVTLYVAIYSPVAACVFRFFAETLRNGLRCARNRRRKNKTRYSLAQQPQHSYQQNNNGYINNNIADNNYTDNILTVCNSIISCAVIWSAFFLSNINLLQNLTTNPNNLMSSTSIIGLHQSFICNDIYMASIQQHHLQKEINLPSMVYQQHLSQQQILLQEQQHRYRQMQILNEQHDVLTMNTSTRLRTLWLIFLICAFLVPLAIISILSGVLLFRLHCRPPPTRNPLADVIPRDTVTSYSTSGAAALSEYAATMTSQRDNIILIMAVSVSRSLCWLPVQICLLLDVFGPNSENNRWSSFHMNVELLGTSFALLGCSLDPIIYYFTSADFRRSLLRTSRRLCRRDKGPKHLALERLSQARNQRNQNERSSINNGDIGGVYERCGSGSSKRPTDNFDPKYNSLLKNSEAEANETILSIISDSSNRINYT